MGSYNTPQGLKASDFYALIVRDKALTCHCPGVQCYSRNSYIIYPTVGRPANAMAISSAGYS